MQLSQAVADLTRTGTTKASPSVLRLVSIDPALPAASPTSPRPLLAALLGALAGIVVAVLVGLVRELLDTRIRPAVAQDGGDIVFNRFETETGVVYLHMRGACSGCPSSSATLKAGVENMLKHYVPEVSRVEQAL